MSIVIGQLKKNAAFKNVITGEVIHILESSVEKTWQSPKGKLKYNALSLDKGIKASISSIQTFQEKQMNDLEPVSLSEVDELYKQLSESIE